MQKNIQFGALISLMICGFVPVVGHCAVTPEQLIEERSRNLEHVSLDWKFEMRAIKPEEPAAWLEKDIQSAELDGRAEAQREGLTDPIMIQKSIDGRVAGAKEFAKGYDTRYSGTWSTAVDGSRTLVSGSALSGRIYISNSSVFGTADSCFIIDNGGTDSEIKELPPNDMAYVYACPGEGWSNRTPTGNRIRIEPEEYSMLLGRNPLHMHGLLWKLTNTTDAMWVFEAEEIDVPGGHPLHYTVNVNREYNAPVSINVTDDVTHKVVKSIVAEKFEKMGSTWMPTEIHEEQQIFDLSETRQWSLAKINDAKALTPPVAKGATLKDYRLLGLLSPRDVLRVLGSKDDRILYYTWEGTLPSIDELQKLHELYRKHSGDKTAYSPAVLELLGIALPILGSVLLWKSKD